MSATIAIKGLPPDVTKSDITTLCGQFGQMVDVTILPGGTEAMVTFDQSSHADLAVIGLKDFKLRGCKLVVDILSLPVAEEKSDSEEKPGSSGTTLLGLFQGLDPAAKIALLTQLQMECSQTSSKSSAEDPKGGLTGGLTGDKSDSGKSGSGKMNPPPSSGKAETQSHTPPSQMPWFVTKAHVEPPRLPVFSGDGKECTYAQWRYEVSCLQSGGLYPPGVLMQAIRRSVRNKAAEVLLHLGESASIKQILQKYDARFGEVLSMQQLLGKFYETTQGDDEGITLWGCRIEDLMSRARADGKLPDDMAAHMLRTKFWSGLKSENLKSALRSRVESGTSFDELIVYARTVEQEWSNGSGSVGKGKPVKAGQSVLQAAPSSLQNVETKLDELLKQMRTLDGRVQKLERRDETGRGSAGHEGARSSEPDKTKGDYKHQNSYGGSHSADQSAQRQKGGRWKCNYCKEWGHIKRDCPVLLAKQGHQGE